MASHLDRRNALALTLGGVLTATALGVSFCETPRRETAPEITAEAMVSHTPEHAWPPSAGDLDAELAATATAIQRLSELSAYDAGVDGGEIDAGPPIAIPDGDLVGVQVRRGRHEDIHFIEVVIGDASFDDPLPLVVVLHGRGGSAGLPGGPFLGLAHPVRVIVPQAPDRLASGWEWLPVSVGSGLVDRLASSLFQVSSRIARMIRTVAAERPTIGRAIVTGFSQGGLLTYALALHHDDVVSHAFPLSTWLPPPLEPLYRRDDLHYPRIRSMHGGADPIIPVAPTRELVSRLLARGFEVELQEFEGVGHEMSDAMDTLFHTWLDRAVCDVVGDSECAAPPILDDGGVPIDGTIVGDGGAPDGSL